MQNEISSRKPRTKKRYELTETALKKIQNRKPPEKDTNICDGNGLYLRHTTTGEMIWKLNYCVKGKKNDNGNTKRSIMTLGRYPSMSLFEARNLAKEKKDQARKGINPYEEELKLKQDIQNKDKTFQEIADLWYNEKIKDASLEPRTKSLIKSRIEIHIYPKIE